MARPRSETIPKEPHSVSLKVLRLSRPTLAQQHHLPYNVIPDDDFQINIPPSASLAYQHQIPEPASGGVRTSFALSPVLGLPSSFGSAYVGERFSCSLCINDELNRGEGEVGRGAGREVREVKDVRILAEMQTPSSTVPLKLEPEGKEEGGESGEFGEGRGTVQKIVHFDLKEEGTHVLAVGVSYTEVVLGRDTEDPAAEDVDVGTDQVNTTSRTRSFRKLYQFSTTPILSVRTKATELPPLGVEDRTKGPYGREELLRYVLEAQLENVSEQSVIVEKGTLKARSPWEVKGLNWDDEDSEDDGAASEEEVEAIGGQEVAGGEQGQQPKENPILNPRDVLQLCYVLTQKQGTMDGVGELKADMKRDGRTVLGQLSISWRGSMGVRGSLSTGGLMTRRK